MPESFRAATAVTEVTAPSGSGPRSFEARVHDHWDIEGNANGGYVLAIAGRAMQEVIGRPPVTITAHYLAPVASGPCRVEVTMIRSGRTLATASAGMWQGERQVLSVLGTFGDQREQEFRFSTGRVPDLPSFDDPSIRATPEMLEASPGIMENIDVRMRPEDSAFRTGGRSGRAEVEGYFTLREPEDVDAIGLLLAADAFAPPIFNLDAPVGWVPTVELTVHVRGVPASGPLRCRFQTRYIHGGLLEEDGEMFDETGTLVAQSRQLALVPRWE